MEKIRVKIPCTHCGTLFDIKPYLLNKPTKYGRFCSMKCRSLFVGPRATESLKTRVTLPCSFCGTLFTLQPYRLRDGSKNHFCSISCSTKYTLAMRWANGPSLVTVICAQCDKEKAIPEWEEREREIRGQTQFFCDRACFGAWKSQHWKLENNPSWKGGWTPHGKGWAIMCNQVRREQKYRCKDCRVTEKTLRRALDVHHIVAARFFETEEAASTRTNLVALCHKCHVKRERNELPLFAIAKTPSYRRRKSRDQKPWLIVLSF